MPYKGQCVTKVIRYIDKTLTHEKSSYFVVSEVRLSLLTVNQLVKAKRVQSATVKRSRKNPFTFTPGDVIFSSSLTV